MPLWLTALAPWKPRGYYAAQWLRAAIDVIQPAERVAQLPGIVDEDGARNIARCEKVSTAWQSQKKRSSRS